MSGSRDKTVKLWNTLGECKYTIGEPDGHTEWVSCVRFSPVTTNPIIVSAGWDKLVKAREPGPHTLRDTHKRRACQRLLVALRCFPFCKGNAVETGVETSKFCSCKITNTVRCDRLLLVSGARSPLAPEQPQL